MIQDYTLHLLEKALHAALSLDETMQTKLLPLESKVIQVVLMPFQWSFFIRISNGQLLLMSASSAVPDTIIRSSPMGFIRLSLLPASQLRSLFHDGIQIEGDVQLGQHLKRLMDELDIDWEGHLARFTGDMVAHQLGRGVRKISQVAEDIRTSLTFQANAHFKNHDAILPTVECVDDFCDDVSQLTLDVERLEAKIKLREQGA